MAPDSELLSETPERADFPSAETGSLAAKHAEVRAAFEEFIGNIQKTGMLSSEQIQSQRSWIESIGDNAEQIEEARQAYKVRAHEKISEIHDLYKNNFLLPLNSALEDGAISHDSYREWINWIRSSSRDSSEKKQSILSSFPEYIASRRKLAAQRENLLRNPRLERVMKDGSLTLKGQIALLKNKDTFMNTLSFTERKSLIQNIYREIPLAENEMKYFKQMTDVLDTAMKEKLISKESYNGWVARFKDHNLSHSTKEYFITRQLPEFRKNWEAAKKQRKKLMENPLFKDLKNIYGLADFKDETKFIALHQDKKQNLLNQVQAALTAKQKGSEKLLQETKDLLQAAAVNGYISPDKVGPWMRHVINGNRTLDELKGFIKDWAKVRYRFDKSQRTMKQKGVPQGLQELSVHAFTRLSYEQRKSYVEEVERRLKIEEKAPTGKIGELKLEIRHALDTEDWDEAQALIFDAKNIAKGEDLNEVQSMQRHLIAFRKTAQEKEKPKQRTPKEIEASIKAKLAEVPSGWRAYYESAIELGSVENPDKFSKAMQMIYNWQWCRQREYLTPEKEEDMLNNAPKTMERAKREGVGQKQLAVVDPEVVSDEEQKPSIPDYHGRWAPTVYFLGEGNAHEELFSKMNAASAYWTTVIPKRGATYEQTDYLIHNVNWKLKKDVRELHAARKSTVSLPQKEAAKQNADYQVAA